MKTVGAVAAGTLRYSLIEPKTYIKEQIDADLRNPSDKYLLDVDSKKMIPVGEVKWETILDIYHGTENYVILSVVDTGGYDE